MKNREDVIEMHVKAVKNFLNYCNASVKAYIYRYMPIYGKLKEKYPNVDIISTNKITKNKVYSKIVIKYPYYHNFCLSTNVVNDNFVNNFVFIDERNFVYIVDAKTIKKNIAKFEEKIDKATNNSFYLVTPDFINANCIKKFSMF